MPRICTVCHHPNREAIDQALFAGEPYRQLAARTGTSTGALLRHKTDHLPATLRKAADATEAARGNDLLAKIADLEAAARRIAAKDVGPKMLAEAKRHAAKVYRKIGIETAWTDCPSAPGQAGLYPECVELRNGRAVLNLQILSKKMAGKSGFNNKTFGFALATRGREFAVRANVFAHRVEDLAYFCRPSKAEILGHVMAHELGHLFLGPGSHSSSGLMGFPWDKKRLRMAAEGSLKFTSGQGEEIRSQVRSRILADSFLRRSPQEK